jgi:hypothetical protein
MGYPKTSKQTLLARLGYTPGRGTTTGLTSKGSADVVVPELPRLPRALTPATIAKWNEDSERWRENLSGQFPIPK